MESEKVKEIKKVLDEGQFTTIKHHQKEGKPILVSFADILTYINELESENERLKHLREVDNKTMTTLRQANNELNECMDEMQDRIAELEKENGKQLKQFAERVIEKLKNNVNADNVDCFVNCKKILDETLKELQGERD